MARQYTLMKLRTTQYLVLGEVPSRGLLLDLIHSLFNNFACLYFFLDQNGPHHLSFLQVLSSSANSIIIFSNIQAIRQI